MDFTIVPMQARHVPALAALERLCFSDPWPEAAFMPELENPLSLWLVAECGGTVAGYIGSQIVPDEADMMNLAVAPEFRRQGLGRTLTLALFDALRARGVVSVTLEVFDMSGRLLLRRQESGASNGSLYTMNWNLDLDGGAKLQTGVYLYRVLLTADGATTTSKAKKLVVIGNK